MEREVLVCQYRNCLSQGSSDVLAAFEAEVVPGATIVPTGCLGQCSSGPTVRVTPDEIWYCRVTPKQVPQIIHSHLCEDKPVAELLNPRIHVRYD